jgi:hypothetical protein
MDRRPIQNFTYDWSFFLFAGDKLVYECIENQVKKNFFSSCDSIEASTVDNQKDIYKRNSEKERQEDGETERWREL